MEALVNAGGKGSRMGPCGIEKPMQIIGGKPTVMRVVEALLGSRHISRVLVSVSDNTLETERYLQDNCVETIRTSGESFMDDLHEAFSVMNGKYVMDTPSDLPLLTNNVVNSIFESFNPVHESMTVLVSCDTIRKLGVKPSFSTERYGRWWAVSGISIMDREKTLKGDYLQEAFLETDWEELALNVNTQNELQRARDYFS